MSKSLAQLKKDAKSGCLFAEMIVNNGMTEIPERLRGKRPIVDANSVAIFFKNADGKKSELRVERASLVDYADEFLTIYRPALRELNPEEQSIMDEWKAIAETPQYIKEASNDALTDGSTTYYQKKSFFHTKGRDYLCGLEEQGGCKYDFGTQKVRDSSIKGDISIQYKLYRT